MYTKGSALEIQFAPRRLSDGAGDPYWIDLTREEAQDLMHLLQTRLADTSGDTAHAGAPTPPLVFALDGHQDDPAIAARLDQAGSPGQQNRSNPPTSPAETEFRQWVCIICGWVYDEEAGWPADGIAPGTRWEDIPDDWRCPECDVGKEDFSMVAF